MLPNPYPEDLWERLSPLLSEERRRKMESVADQRTDRLRLVLQDIHHPHNISACLRSAEAFGVTHVHVIHRHEPFRASSVAKGVDRWLNVHKHKDIISCVKDLKEKNFKIVAAMPNPDSCVSLEELSFDQPLALLLGNEHEGVSEEFRPYVDAYYTIPMAGMVESLNISVCAAISLYRSKTLAQQKWGSEFFLPDSELRNLKNHWIALQYPRWQELYKGLTART